MGYSKILILFDAFENILFLTLRCAGLFCDVCGLFAMKSHLKSHIYYPHSKDRSTLCITENNCFL